MEIISKNNFWHLLWKTNYRHLGNVGSLTEDLLYHSY
jgi:hypothetical protein